MARPGTRRAAVAVAAAGLALLAVVVVRSALPAAAQTTPCDGFGPVETVGTVQDGSLVEASGLAASRAWPGVYWAHNDSGGRPELSAISESGDALGVWSVAGAEATDWEDIAVGPGPDAGRSYLYIADTGDNQRVRSDITVYRVPEPPTRPTGAAGTLPEVERFHLRYPFDPIDAESLLVDTDGTLYVLTKSYDGPRNSVLAAPAGVLEDGAEVEMSEVATFDAVLPPEPSLGLPGFLVTGADISPDGDLVLVRTYQAVLAHPRAPGQSVADAIAAPPCLAPAPDELIGEAIAVSADGTAYLTVAEGEHPPIHRVAVLPSAPSTTTPPDRPTTPPASSEGSTSTRAWVAAAVAAGAIAAVGALVVARRRRPGR